VVGLAFVNYDCFPLIQGELLWIQLSCYEALRWSRKLDSACFQSSHLFIQFYYHSSTAFTLQPSEAHIDKSNIKVIGAIITTGSGCISLILKLKNKALMHLDTAINHSTQHKLKKGRI
jgi:hypothetical protein